MGMGMIGRGVVGERVMRLRADDAGGLTDTMAKVGPTRALHIEEWA
jgi:hypothetical protein